MKIYIYLCTIALFAFASCGTKKIINPMEAKGPQIILSHGGGFTGAYKTYYLLDDGQLFKSESEMGNPSMKKAFDKKQAKQIFSNYKVLGLDKVERDTPGNLVYSITMKDEDGLHKIEWGKGQEGTEMLQIFYNNIMNLIMKNNGESTK